MMKNVRLIYLYTVCMNMLFCLAILIPYLNDYIGLSFSDFLIEIHEKHTRLPT